MKKVLVLLILLLVAVIAAIYILIPNRIRISQSMRMEVNKDALYRKLSTAAAWSEWWPGKKTGPDSVYIMNEIKFKPGPALIVSLPVYISSDGLKALSEFTFIQPTIDSTQLQTETVVPTSYNPFKRAAIYFKSKKLESSLSAMLQSIKTTYVSTAQLYGYTIQKEKVVDSTLIFIVTEVKGYPSVTIIYNQVDKLKEYIRKNNAVETGFPMLNIYTADSILYHLKVAIPVDKKLPSAGNISYKWMLGGGNILITEVKGGPYEINKAYEQILNYISDHRRVAPAIPFESLVTDRRMEPDSSKWITRIYYPVM
ncbi:MAG TPA: GyrI-like domain-containing protein [Chitinophagaceae bacterium]